MGTSPSTTALNKLAKGILEHTENQLTFLARNRKLLRHNQKIQLQIHITEVSASDETAMAEPLILDCSIEDLGISEAMSNRLLWQGITTVRSLIETDPRVIAQFRYCGKKFLHTITEALKRRGLDFYVPVPESLTWKPGPSKYEDTLDEVIVQALDEKDWHNIESVPWKKYQRGIIAYIKTIGNRPIAGKKLSRCAPDMHVGTIARCINDQFERAGLPLRLKATTNIDPEDKLKLSWGFQIGVLPKE